LICQLYFIEFELLSLVIASKRS